MDEEDSTHLLFRCPSSCNICRTTRTKMLVALYSKFYRYFKVKMQLCFAVYLMEHAYESKETTIYILR
jgi:hypothetical protein